MQNIPEVIFFVIGIALGLIGNLLACKGYNTGWWLAVVRMLHFMPFYSLGIFYNRTLESMKESFPVFFILQ